MNKIILAEIFQLTTTSAIILLPVNPIFKILFFFVLITTTNIFLIKKLKKDKDVEVQLENLNSSIEILLNKESSCYFIVDNSKKIIEKKYNKNIDNVVLSNIFSDNLITNIEILRYIEQCIENKNEINTTISIKYNNYSFVYFSVIIRNIIKNNKDYIVVIMFDITDKKTALKFLKESETKFTDFANLIPDCIAECDLKGNILFLNKSTEKIFGYSKDSIKNISQIILEEDKEKAFSNIQSLIKTHEKNSNAFLGPIEYKLQDINGNILYCKVISNIRINEFGVKTVISVISDISKYHLQQQFLERKLQFEKLISSISKRFLTNDLETIQDSFTEFSNFLNLDSIYVFLNDKEINKTNLEHSYSKNVNLNKEEKINFLKVLYSICKNEKFVF